MKEMQNWDNICKQLCESAIREHEHYYDPDTGYSYDDEGNSWKGAPNPKYDVGGYWPHSGRNSWWKGGGNRYSSSRTTKKEPKVIDKDKLYFGRPANTDSALIYFLLQASGLALGTYKLPSGVDKGERSYEQDIHALAEELCGCEFGNLKLFRTQEENFRRIFSSCIAYFKKDKSQRNSEDVKSTLKDVFEKGITSEEEEIDEHQWRGKMADSNYRHKDYSDTYWGSFDKGGKPTGGYDILKPNVINNIFGDEPKDENDAAYMFRMLNLVLAKRYYLSTLCDYSSKDIPERIAHIASIICGKEFTKPVDGYDAKAVEKELGNINNADELKNYISTLFV